MQALLGWGVLLVTVVKRILKFEVAKRGPTMLPKGCELSDQRPARIVEVGIQLEPIHSVAVGHMAAGPVTAVMRWEDKVVVWVEVSYDYDNGNMPALELVPVNLHTVMTGSEVASPGAEYVGTAQIQHDGINNGAPLVMHVYRLPTIKIQMHVEFDNQASQQIRGVGAAAAAIERERRRS